jgi:hypothetical protein
MSPDHPNHHRRSIRLDGYDYTQPGVYFVTMVTWQRECLFGEIVNGEMRLNTPGISSGSATIMSTSSEMKANWPTYSPTSSIIPGNGIWTKKIRRNKDKVN